MITSQADIEQNMVSFYESLVGTAASDITHLDIVAMRGGT